ncbi:MAG: dicarboxylate/amino acid:cation symporter, partial [Proteobacteria bacterium]|nr:dicarboxylate/amino acid:cation symporter [Pseudomonadota bacterium]
MSMTSRVLLALVLGALVGLALAWGDAALAVRVADAVQPIGRLWLNALQMTVVPLVLALVVIGVTTTSNAATSGRTARRAIVVFLVLLSAAALFTAIAAPALLSLVPLDPALTQALSASVASGAPVAATGWADALTAIIPSNAIAAAAQSAMLPLVVFSLFFGFALTRIAADRRQQVVGILQAIA